MSTTSFTSLRRFSASVLTLLLFCVAFGNQAGAQTNPPLVTGSFATSLTAPSGLGTVVQTALDANGDWLVLDYVNGALYEYPVNGGAMITLAPPGTLGSVGGYQNPGIVFDSSNNLFIAGNFNNCLLMFPYDTTTKTWDGLATLDTKANTGPDQCGIAPYSFAQYNLITPVAPLTVNYIQPWGLAMAPGNTLVIGSQDGGNYIFTLPVIYSPTPAAGCVPGPNNPGDCSPYATPGTDDSSAATLILLSMTKRPNSVAADKFGNIYFVEDSGGLSGAYMIPAGEVNIASDTDPSIVRVDPNLANVTAVTTDPSGNLYISDSQAGVFMVPNPSGVPNPAAAVMLTSVPATGQVSVDSTRGILYVPTSNNGLTKVTFNAAELGSTPAGAPAATSQSVLFGFNGAVTPGSFVIQEAGAGTPDFTIGTGGTCASGTAYSAQSGCSVAVTLDPHSAGSVSAAVQVLDASGNVLGSMPVHGTGVGSAVNIMPGGESAIGAGLKTPSQIAVDAAGNTYVADSGLGTVVMYPRVSGGAAPAINVGTGLTAPTGVAVDGAGDVFIADSGNVMEVPIGPSGLNAAGQITLKTGLGTNLKLAADGSGHLYISDPDDHQVVELANFGGSFGLLGQMETDLTTFNAPSALAVDSNDNLYVADGSNLIEVAPDGTQSTVLSSLANATGMAVDSSGAVYVATPGGTVRIPNESGTLNPSDETVIASDVTAPTSVALDSAMNLYITDGTLGDVDFVGASASSNFGTQPPPPTSPVTPDDYTILNSGNSPLNIGGFAGTPDFTETATSCSGPVAVGSSCSATVTFSPGPGDQGTLSGEVLVTSDAANSPVGINAVGVGAALATSTTSVVVTNATVNGASTAVSVVPTSGTTPTPSGSVTLTVTGNGITPIVLPQTLSATGTAAFDPTQLPAGSYTFAVSYQGDRAYSGSNTSATVVVGAGAVTLTQPTLAEVQQVATEYPYILSSGNGAQEPYDSTAQPYYYTYPVTVVATDGSPLIGVLNPDGKTYNYGAVTYQVTGGGSAPGCAAVPVAADGTAPLNTTCFDIDTSNTTIPDLMTAYTVTPVYSPAGSNPVADTPNPNYAPATGTPISFTALRNPMVAITSNPSSLSVSPGSSVTATLTLTSILGYGVAGAAATLNNYGLPVELSCDGLPAYATCSFSYPTPDPSDPNSVDVTPTAPGTVIMTINTSVPSGNVAGLHRGFSETTFAGIFGLGLLGFAFGKKKSLLPRLLTMICLMLASGMIAGISGCSTKQLGSSGTATPAGGYAVTVTAKQVGSVQVAGALPGQLVTVYGNQNQMSLPFTINVTIQ